MENDNETKRDWIDFEIIDVEHVSDGWQTTYTYKGVQDVCKKTSIDFGEWCLIYVIKLIGGYYIRDKKVTVKTFEDVYNVYLGFSADKN